MCTSITGKLMKIPYAEFYKKMMKDAKALSCLSQNMLDKKRKTTVKVKCEVEERK